MSRLEVLHVERYQHEATARGHSIVVDEPEDVGGQDQGLSPYELLLAALGGCTAITLRMYAQRKGWSLQDVRVSLSHERSHAEDCEQCDSTEGKLDVLRRRIELVGELDEDQREKLREIAAKCPVHRTLHSEVKVRTQLK